MQGGDHRAAVPGAGKTSEAPASRNGGRAQEAPWRRGIPRDSRARRRSGDRRGDHRLGEARRAIKKIAPVIAGAKLEVKLADKPGSVVDSHSSRRRVAPALEPSTRGLGEPRRRPPI